MEILELGLLAMIVQTAATVYWVRKAQRPQHVMPLARLHGRVIPKTEF